MRMDVRRQLIALGLALVLYALLAFVSYLVIPLDQLAVPGQAIPAAVAAMPRWQLAASNAGFVFVIYGLLGLAALWFARRLELPGMYREAAGWRAWVITPLLLGLGIGVVLVILDQIIARVSGLEGFPHPAFPLSVLASGSAGIGEEILFRGFVMGLWAALLNLVLKRWSGRSAALWIGNVIGALAFSASHVPSAVLLLKVASAAQLPLAIWIELFALNGLVGLVCGQKYIRDGLVAAMGIHFWADVVWHVIWPLLGIGV